jgi:hypothetical protein
MTGIPRKAERSGRVLWDYLRVDLPPKESRIILVMGCPDIMVAEHAARLMHENMAKSMIVSGGCRFSAADPRKEADVFADVIEGMGVDPDLVFRETRSTHTSDHFWQAEKDLGGSGFRPESAILCCAPVAEQRALATGRNRWVGVDLSLGGVPVSYEAYLQRSAAGAGYVLSRMVGEVERILAYPERGFMNPPETPVDPSVLRAYELLKKDFHDRPIPRGGPRHRGG